MAAPLTFNFKIVIHMVQVKTLHYASTVQFSRRAGGTVSNKGSVLFWCREIWRCWCMIVLSLKLPKITKVFLWDWRTANLLVYGDWEVTYLVICGFHCIIQHPSIHHVLRHRSKNFLERCLKKNRSHYSMFQLKHFVEYFEGLFLNTTNFGVRTILIY